MESDYGIMDLLEGKGTQRLSSIIMHNWGSSGSITLEHGLDSHVQSSPNGRANGRANGIAPATTGHSNGHHHHHRPNEATTNRKRPRDAIYPEETYRLRPDSGEDLDHIKVEYKEPGCCNTKYSQQLMHLLPFRPKRKDKRLLPGSSAGLFSYFTVHWLTRLMVKAFKSGLQPSDLWTIQADDGAEKNADRLLRLWEDEVSTSRKANQRPQLWRAVWRGVRTRVVVCMVISVFQNVLQFLGPSVLLKLVLDYINSPTIDFQYAAIITVSILIVNMLRGACFNAMFVVGTHTATRVTGAIQALMYKKILKLKTGGERLSAQIINFCNNDMERLFEACISCVFLTAMPIIFTLSVIYSVYILGPWSLLGQAVFVCFYPIMGLIAKAQSKVRVQTVKVTDKRVTLMNEILNSIRLIKMYSWEESFAEKIAGLRKEELKKHRVGALLQAVSSTVVPSISILATIVTFLGYTLTGNTLTSSEAFTIFSVFNAMQFSVGTLPFTVRSVAEAKVSLTRIQKLLELPEHKKRNGGLVNNNLALQIKNGTFAWEVTNIDFKAKDSKEDHPPERTESKKQNGVKSNGSVPNGNHHSNGVVLNGSSPNGNTVNGNTHNGNSPNGNSNGMNGIIPTAEPNSVKTVTILFNLNLSVQRGKLIGVCGSIGSGKSSLLSAICGDMKVESGDLQANGRLALVTQQAWIYNATLRENIIIGQKFDEEKYKEVLRVCSLQSDLNLLSNGDMTEIGDRGSTLSGGQKQRVNLGRAVYSDRDIYLLDDPLSAVDTKVAKHIFGECIKGSLASKTVIFVTHATHFLEQCDEIVVMQTGKIAERGTHSELMERKGDYFDMVGLDSSGKEKKNEDNNTQKPSEKADSAESKEQESLNSGKLITEETSATGSVPMKMYVTFIKVCGGWCIVGLIFFAIVIFTLSRMFNAVWLQTWLDQGDGRKEERKENITMYNLTFSGDELLGSVTHNPDLWMYQLVYIMSFVMLLITGVIKGTGVTFRVLSGSSRLHNDMFWSIIRSPMSFFDTTPSGRIINRFSRDLDELDVRVPFFLEFILQGLLMVVGQMMLVCFIYVWFVVPLVLIAILFAGIDIFLNVGVRELKRLDNVLKSPVTQHISSSVSGISVIRTFDRESLFLSRMYKYLDQHSVALLVFRLSNRWFTYRMDIMAVMITFAITGICVFTKGSVSTALAGLALSTVNGVCVFIPFLMRMKSEFQSRITSVERIIEYAYDLKSEAPCEIKETQPPPDWPKTGAIELKEVKLRYRPELPLVLHGISASIRDGEKIGIIGRTGAGKSSLISTLLRLSELDSGSVFVDGIDISTIGLHVLRSSISVIPQDPVLFHGSIRYNLDPFDRHSDDAVWQALERSHLKAVVQKQEHGLMSMVEAAGENFSVGERQLICLTRALLRNSKILLLDEATASVDVETDHLIQTTIKEAFVRSTVLTIAHRLNTIASYDRIMVLDAGRVKEFDTPEALMCTEGSLFKDMMGAMGVYTVEQMRSLN
ncbi:ATP-binding cassette sub-family C member 5-like isoform X2 [Macrobrachium nipponense]|uniref:ATP-binding cassette sub-family C member 5-like isoform X2 n=1 Tax=Macrobrachium nipponense TaxID=159736 RepID=UPI0030C7ECB7